MFLNNRYKRIYDQLCERALGRVLVEYTEKHHVIPKSLGGLNTKDNLVRLTAREHYVAHLCLVRCTEGLKQFKMLCAVQRFRGWRYQINSRLYASLSVCRAKAMRGNSLHNIPHTMQSRQKMSESHKGQKSLPHQREQCRLLGLSRKGKVFSQEHCQKLSNAKLGTTQSSATRQRRSVALKLYWAKRRSSDAHSTVLNG
jgi:hypothetical protein